MEQNYMHICVFKIGKKIKTDNVLKYRGSKNKSKLDTRHAENESFIYIPSHSSGSRGWGRALVT